MEDEPMLLNPSLLPIELGRFEHGIVRRKVRQLIGCYGFHEQDRESLKQELLTRILQGLKSFDPAQAHRNAFVTTIVERSVATIVRDKRAEKRDHRRIRSLNVMIGDGGENRTELSATIGQPAYDARRCRESRSDGDLSELSSDIAELLAHLPGELQLLAEQLKHKSISQIAREMGIPRTTLRERLVELRERFEAAEMRMHL
jgi:RNA polymerase sigma-70 factor, ECF subfamily